MLPGTAAGSLVGAPIGPQPGDGSPGVLDVLSRARATWTVVAYVLAFLVITLTATRHRDVS